MLLFFWMNFSFQSANSLDNLLQASYIESDQELFFKHSGVNKLKIK